MILEFCVALKKAGGGETQLKTVQGGTREDMTREKENGGRKNNTSGVKEDYPY